MKRKPAADAGLRCDEDSRLMLWAADGKVQKRIMMMKYFKNTMVILAAAVLLCMTGITSCSVKDHLQDEQPVEILQKEVSNNCGQFVEYENHVYHWKYSGSSVSEIGLWADYDWDPSAENQLICRDEMGSERVIYTGRGSGKIVIYGDKLYIEGWDSQERHVIWRLNPDGTGMETIAENAAMLAVDESSGNLVYQNVEEDLVWGYSFGVMDLSEGTSTVVSEEGQFLDLKDGVIYYEDETGIDKESREKGTVALWKVKSDGTEKMQLAVTEPEIYLQDDFYRELPASEIVHFQLTDQYAYFTYGTFSGSAACYQGGGLSRVKTDGTGYQRIYNEENEEGWLKGVEENFIVVQEDGEEWVYFQVFGGYLCTNMNTGETESTDIVPGTEGTICLNEEADVVCYDGSSCRPAKLMQSGQYAGYTDALKNREFTEDDYCSMRDMEIAGDWLYYTVEKSSYSPENNVGWRYCYKREASVVYRYHLKTGESQELYRYDGA